MSKHRITFLMVGDRKGITRKFAVSAIWLKVALVICTIGFISFSAVIVDYFSLVVEIAENKQIALKKYANERTDVFFTRKTRYFRR